MAKLDPRRRLARPQRLRGDSTIINSNRGPRLNPFGFPSNVDFNLVLIVVSAVGATLFVYNWLWFGIPANQGRYDQAIQRCGVGRPFGAGALLSLAAEDPEGIRAARGEENAALLCRAGLETEIAFFMVTGLAALALVGGATYLTYPARMRKKGGYRALSASDAPEVVDYIEDLRQTAGVSPAPTLLWNPLNASPNGLVFGRFGKYYLALSGGLVTQYYSDRQAFRAVVLHEFGHLRNRDVDKTYLTVSIWQAFVLTGLLPLGVSLIPFAMSWPAVLVQATWRVGVLALVVYLSRNAVLRARELYADVRASVWDGPAGALAGVLERLPERSSVGIRRLLRVHPAPAQRRRVLSDPRSLFEVSPWAAFAVGLIALAAFPSLWSWLSILTSSLAAIRGGFLTHMSASLIVSPLIVGVLGIGIWRRTFASQIGGAGRHVHFIGLAVGLAAGSMVGEVLSFESFVRISMSGYPFIPLLPGSTLGLVMAYATFGLLSGLFVLALAGLLTWISSSSLGWLRLAASRRSPRPVYLAGFLVGALLFTILIGSYIPIRELITAAAADLRTPADLKTLVALVALALPNYLIQQPLTVLGLALLWAFPLSAWLFLREREETVLAEWVYLDHDGPRPPTTSPVPWRLRRSLTGGLAAGLAFGALLLVARVSLRAVFPEVTRGTDTFKLISYFGQVGAAVLLQAGVALVVALSTGFLSTAHGLFAAFVGGTVMVVGILGLNLLFGGSVDLPFAWQTFSTVIVAGALLSIFSVVGGLLTQRLIRASRPQVATQ